MKKPRSDSKLLNLPEEQYSQLVDWLLSGMPYHKVKALLEKEFRVQTSMAALSGFWDVAVSSELIARRQHAVTTADEIAEEAKKKPGQFDVATLDAIRQKALAISLDPRASGGEVKALFMLLLRARDQELKNKDIEIKLRRLELLERNAAQAKDVLTTVAAKGGLSPETIREIEEAAKLL